MFDDELDDWADEADTEIEPDPEPIDPEEDDETEPAPGDFWLETDDAGEE